MRLQIFVLNLIIQNLTDPGDTVITEEFVYLGTLNQLNKAEADIVGARMDDEGIIPEELDKLISELLSQGKKINGVSLLIYFCHGRKPILIYFPDHF